MGNCWPKPVTNLATSSKVSSPVHSDRKTKKGSSSHSNNNASKDGSNKEIPDPVQVREIVPPSGQIVTPNLKMFTLATLKSATRNFRPDTVLGEGGFGTVFKGWIDENTYAPSKVGFGLAVAVKKSNPDSPQGLKEWQAEVKFLGKFSHPNLVKLLGYCWEDRAFLLVYEYMQKGSLENHLFRKGAEPLSWDRRLKIAIGAARGLAFLHTTEKQVIYRDFKASNILLDGEFNAKLSDFGLAKLGPIDGESHVSTGIVGTYGYAAPEYLATGHLYVKSDVYGFGVVLLEILTGRRVLDLTRPTREHNLVDWSMPCLSEKRKLKRIMDPQLSSDYPLKAAFQSAALVLKCLEPEPKNRPSMEEVLEDLEQISAIIKTPKESKVSVRPSNHRHHNHHHRSPLHSHYVGTGGSTGPRANRHELPPTRSY